MYSFLISFFNDLDKFNKLKPKKKKQKRKKKTNVDDTASELYNDLLEMYFYRYEALSDVIKRKLHNKFDSLNSFLEE